jgi:hypothetical protein
MSSACHLLCTVVLAQAGAGRIQGGWEYVWGAYAVTWTALLLYVTSLWLRRPKASGPEGK